MNFTDCVTLLCQSFLTVFMQFNHLFNCLWHMAFMLTEETDVDAVKRHTGHILLRICDMQSV